MCESLIQNRPKRRGRCVRARSKAQELAFSPVVFYAAVAMRDMGLLACLARCSTTGVTETELAVQLELNDYAVSMLLRLGGDAGLVDLDEGIYTLTDLGYLIEGDPMTQVNMNFVRDVCYGALPFLGQSLQEGRPAGLHTLGDWDTLYEGITQLPEPARKSWYDFDHYYSDAIFDAALPLVFDRPVGRIVDVGANTGRWAFKCLQYDKKVKLRLVDLPGQIEIARASFEHRGLADRVDYHPMDVLSDDTAIPTDCDVIWMSQFLDCFDPASIKQILKSVSGSRARLCIVEPFSDKQAFSAASLSVNATSLYFSCVANGVSRMYRYDEFSRWVEQSGWLIDTVHSFSAGHTLMICHSIERDAYDNH